MCAVELTPNPLQHSPEVHCIFSVTCLVASSQTICVFFLKYTKHLGTRSQSHHYQAFTLSALNVKPPMSFGTITKQFAAGFFSSAINVLLCTEGEINSKQSAAFSSSAFKCLGTLVRWNKDQTMCCIYLKFTKCPATLHCHQTVAFSSSMLNV